MKHKPWSMIVAVSENGVIGNNGKIPWHIPEDLRWFKRMTVGNTVVMGRKTYESIGKPLPDRRTVVLSRSGFQADGVIVVSSLSEIHALPPYGETYICGGEQVYRKALPMCDRLYRTFVRRTVDGDAFFPPFEPRFKFRVVLFSYPEHCVQLWVAVPRQGKRGFVCEDCLHHWVSPCRDYQSQSSETCPKCGVDNAPLAAWGDATVEVDELGNLI